MDRFCLALLSGRGPWWLKMSGRTVDVGGLMDIGVVTGSTGDDAVLDFGPIRSEARHLLLLGSPPLEQRELHLATLHVRFGALESIHSPWRFTLIRLPPHEHHFERHRNFWSYSLSKGDLTRRPGAFEEDRIEDRIEGRRLETRKESVEETRRRDESKHCRGRHPH